jgi:invasion protein IalB
MKFKVILASLFVFGNAQAQEPLSTRPSLPGGASSLQESFEDWLVLCNVAGNAKQCAVNQVQTDTKSGQRILAVEMMPTSTGGTSGNIVMPFGLDLASGLSFVVDGAGAPKPLAFKTCLPSGCIVPAVFDKATLSALKAGKQLRLTGRSADDPTKPVNLTVSLKGLGPALDRVAGILK